MTSGSARPPLDQQGSAWIALAFALATALRIAFVIAFPTLHGGDAAARLAHADMLVLGYQLPLPQLFVMLGKSIADDPRLVRVLFCIWGGVLAAGLTALLALTIGHRGAIFGALLFSFDPLLTHYSIVPYQEPVAYALVAWAFFFAASDRARTGAILLGGACLSRYEAWLFLPAFWSVSRSRSAALIAAAPIAAWVLRWQGLAPRGFYVLDIDMQANRLSRVVYLAGKFVEYETALGLTLALAGLVVATASRERAALKYTGALALVTAWVVLLGHEYPPGSGLMSERLIHLPVLLVLSLSAFALAHLSATSRPAFMACLGIVVLLAGRNVRFERGLLKAAAADPDLALARDTARAIEALLSPGECVTVLAPTVDPALLRAYVSKVGFAFGDVENARGRARGLVGTSPDRDRIAAHLKAKVGTVRGEMGCPLLALVDDAGASSAPTTPAMTLLAEVSAGPRRARILRTRD